MFTCEEREGPRSGWVSRRDRSILGRENRLCECLAGTEMGLFAEEMECQMPMLLDHSEQ